MKIVQTFWSGSGKNIKPLDNSYGWFSSDYHLISWAFSCLNLRKFYDDVVLYTDIKGKEILIDYLQLPYTKVITDLDELNYLDSDLWALSKIYSYSKQKEPFLHVDGDVFIWKAFDEELLKGSLISQNIEIGTENHYVEMFNELEKQLTYIPKAIVESKFKEENIFAYNAGILGGNNIGFFENYTSTCFDFIKKNRSAFNQISKEYLNVFFEQHFFYCLAKKSKISVSTFFDKIIPDNLYQGMGDFHLVPSQKKYLHLIGPFKKDYKTCEKMLRQFRREYPEEYHKIIKLYPKKYKNEIKLKQEENKLFDSSTKKRKEKKNHFYRTQFVYKNLTRIAINEDNPFEAVKSLNNKYLNDVYYYEKSIFEFLHQNIETTDELLLRRDLSNIDNYKIFGCSFDDALKMKIQMSPFTKVSESKWNWIKGKVNSIEQDINENFTINEQKLSILLVSEFEFPKYSEFLIDDLDKLIFENIKNTKTIFKMLENLKEYFNPEELKQSIESFNKLIFGRLENLIFYKCINIY